MELCKKEIYFLFVLEKDITKYIQENIYIIGYAEQGMDVLFYTSKIQINRPEGTKGDIIQLVIWWKLMGTIKG